MDNLQEGFSLFFHHQQELMKDIFGQEIEEQERDGKTFEFLKKMYQIADKSSKGKGTGQ
jgi:hypothetical protein